MIMLFYSLGECFDADDDDNGRICGSITPDTVLYTLFRGKKDEKHGMKPVCHHWH